LLFRDTLSIAFSADEMTRARSLGRFMAFASIAVSEKMSPNSMELQKMVANAMALLARDTPLKELLLADQMQVDQSEESGTEILPLSSVIERMRDAVCNRTLDLNFRC